MHTLTFQQLYSTKSAGNLIITVPIDEGINQWLNARLQYLYSWCTEDIAVLHFSIKILSGIAISSACIKSKYIEYVLIYEWYWQWNIV